MERVVCVISRDMAPICRVTRLYYIAHHLPERMMRGGWGWSGQFNIHLYDGGKEIKGE